MFTASTELQNARMVVNSYSNWTDVFKVTYGIKFALWLQQVCYQYSVLFVSDKLNNESSLNVQ